MEIEIIFLYDSSDDSILCSIEWWGNKGALFSYFIQGQ